VLGECRALVDGSLASPAEALAMATVAGAWALGRERRAGVLAPGRPADLVVLRPAQAIRDPYEAALDPGATVVATLRSGTAIHGALTG
jgi:imidazolonepropionase-like amidohydrolase